MKGEGIAFLGWSGGKVLVGRGPFLQQASPPEGGIAFYQNDFGLSDSRPWRVPREHALLTPDEVKPWIGEASGLKIQWDPLEATPFADVFQEITQSIRRGSFEKTVPVVVETGHCLQGHPAELLLDSLSAAEPLVPYGYATDECGFTGMSPENLFTVEGRKLRTMALAGTARSDEREVLAVDEKEIREHEFVAQALVSKLGDLGELERGARVVMDLGPIVHFHTPIAVELDREESVDALIARLHPTPALGPLPRTAETMSRLIHWRSRLGAPAAFGAPFGAMVDGMFRAIVAIRGIWWAGSSIQLPAGCGVIEPSRLVNEWRELRLKRQAVKSRFGV